ncbi:HDOD domain-containing protein [Methyloversatilis thermotolerans]|uniref:HDOD domain-containing protein n=1 Tax=Methyloversatilis thermotolerans TaxID=1346290 RepID=UPI000378D364|nr:HDOD domain-containing protein [Methyloversatilis thermotolerans]
MCPHDSAIDGVLPSGLPTLPFLAGVVLGERALPSGADAPAALLRLDPLWVLRLLRASATLALPSSDRVAQRFETTLAVCGQALLRAAVLADFDERQSGRLPDPARCRFQLHSLLCAHIARELAQATGQCDMDEAFFAGLLADVALLLLARSEAGAQRMAQVADEHALASAEIEAVGEHHGAMAARLLHGCASDELLDALRFSHAAADLFADAPVLVRILRAAEELSGGSPNDLDVRLSIASALLKLPPDAVAMALARARDGTATAAAWLELPAAECLVDEAWVFRPEAHTVSAGAPDERLLRRLARDGLLGKAFGHGGDAGIWAQFRVACALLCDCVPLRGWRSEPGSPLWPAIDGGTTEVREALDLSPLTSVREQLIAGRPVWLEDRLAIQALPVNLQRQLAARGEHRVVLLLPLPASGLVEAVALFRLDLAQHRALSADPEALLALAAAAGGAFAHHHRQHRELTEQRRALSEHGQRAIRHLRSELHSPIALSRQQIKAMRLKMGAESLVEPEMGVLGDQIQRIETVLEQFEARPSDVSVEVQRVDLNQLVEQVVADAEQRLFRNRVLTTEMHLDSALPPLHLPAAVIRNVLVSLIAVSADQFGAKGRIAFSTAEGLVVNGTAFAEIRVRDFGRGMDSARLAELFAGDGSQGGRGRLSQALAEVKALGGSLSCKSAVGQGTVFQILLPRTTRRASVIPVL